MKDFLANGTHFVEDGFGLPVGGDSLFAVDRIQIGHRCGSDVLAKTIQNLSKI